LAVAAANPSSAMQRTVSSMIFARVSSPRLRGALVRRVGAMGLELYNIVATIFGR
jgi:hypothetical protein